MERAAHLRSHIGLDLGTLLLLALEYGRGVTGHVLEAMDELWVLPRDLEVSTGSARGSARGRHGRVGGWVRARCVLCGGEVSEAEGEEDVREMEDGEVNGMGRPWHFIYVKPKQPPLIPGR